MQYFYGQNNTRLDQLSNTQQFFKDTAPLTTRSTTRQESDEYTHRIGASLRWKIDSFSTFRYAPQLSIRKSQSERLFNSMAGSNYDPLLNESNNSQRINGNDIWLLP